MGTVQTLSLPIIHIKDWKTQVIASTAAPCIFLIVYFSDEGIDKVKWNSNGINSTA